MDINHIGDLKPDPNNARKHTQRNIGMIVDSLNQEGAARSIVIDENNIILAGNGVIEAAAIAGIENVQVIEGDGNTIIAVRRTGLTPEQKKRLALFDNRTAELAEWDTDQLKIEFDAGLLDGLFGDLELAEFGFEEEGEGEARTTLQERFIVPPFSVLDARQGYWQDRKRTWIELGIQSELGRGGDVHGSTPPHGPNVRQGKDGKLIYKDPTGSHRKDKLSPGGSPRDAANYDGQRGDGRGGNLTYKGQSSQTALQKGLKPNKDLPEDQQRALGGYMANGSVIDREGGTTGTSIFDPVLCEIAYRWFCPKLSNVLDPFAGGSVRGIVAAILGHDYTGVDLSERQIEANKLQGTELTPDKLPNWIMGDSKDIKTLAPGEYDFIFSCPPYADLEVYSEDERDISTMDYTGFLAVYREIIASSVSMLKDNRFACFVVGDVRDKKGFYRNFVSDTIAAFQDAGMTLYNEAILVTAVGSLPIRIGRQFQGYRKLGKTHQNVPVFYKGDPKQIKQFGDVECGDTTGGEPVLVE